VVGLLGARASATPTPTATPTNTPIQIWVEHDTIVEEAHKMNNDGAWGYGWIKLSQGAHNYGLLQFDLSGLASSNLQSFDPQQDIASAKIVLRVAQNHLTQDGTIFDVHAWDLTPDTPVVDWVEGDGRWDLFSYCNDSDLAKPSAETGVDGATWTCSDDAHIWDGNTTCPTPTPGTIIKWQPADNGVQAGFDPTPVATIVEEKDYSDPQNHCPALLTDLQRKCDPLCSESKECIKTHSADECYRTITIDVTQSARDAVSAGKTHPSWLIKRETNTGAGAFHYFSREGALCILGACGQSPYIEHYRQLQPTLEVVLKKPAPGAIVTPALHCSAYDTCD
jgi:hypothetical protein